MKFDFKLVVISRKDLKLSKGKLAVQVAHAAVICSNLARDHYKTWYDKWIDEGQKKVVLEVKNKEEMFRYFTIAKDADLPACSIKDAGLTEVDPGTVTVVGIGPAPENDLDKITGELKLL